MNNKILKNTWIRINDLNETEKNMFFDHYKNNDPVVILCNHKNIEYKIINIDNENIYLQFNNKIYK